jgi:transposase
MTAKLFETALGIEAPWNVQDVSFDMAARTLTILISFTPGSRFSHPDAEGLHPAYDTINKRYRHLNFFQHECYLEVRCPRVQLPDGSVRMVEPSWAGKLAGFTLLFEALILTLCGQMPFAACSRLVNVSWHRIAAICGRYVELSLAQADFSGTRVLAIDETSRSKGHKYVTLAADAERRAVIFVAEGKDAEAVAALADDLRKHGGDPEAIESVSIDMSPAYIKGVTEHLPKAEITFDKFHVIAHASKALDKTRRVEQRSDPDLKGIRWALLKDRCKLNQQQTEDLDGLLAQLTTKRTARSWLYREQLRDILERKQINVVRRMLLQWCVNVMRSKVEPMKEVASLIRNHIEGIVSWARTRRTNGFLEALNGLFQAAKRKARGYGTLKTIRTVIFLLAGKLDFSQINPYMGLPT